MAGKGSGKGFRGLGGKASGAGPRDGARDSSRGAAVPRGASASRDASLARGDERSRKASGAVTPKTADAVRYPFPYQELLAKGLQALGLPAESGRFEPLSVRPIEATLSLLERYIGELELFNAAFDLVAAETGSEQGRADLVVRHILDSLAPWERIARELQKRAIAHVPSDPTVSLSLELADVGSGAGFPGIPLAILFPNVRVTLIERMSKRCAFLENCAAILSLSNVTVLNAELESAPPGAFDVVVFRAFRPLDRAMARALLALCRPDGCLAAWKARKEKIDEEMGAIADAVGHWEVRALTVPFLEHEERNLVIIEQGVTP